MRKVPTTMFLAAIVGVLIGCAVDTRQVRTEWEYARLAVYQGDEFRVAFFTPGWEPIMHEGESIPTWEAMLSDMGCRLGFNGTIDALNCAGSVGWELVNRAPHPTPGTPGMSYIFKRPVP